MRPYSRPKMRMNVKEPSNMFRTLSLEAALKGEGCPIGTVPIRRTTKEDLIRAKLFTKRYTSIISPLTTEKPGLHVSISRIFPLVFFFFLSVSFCLTVLLITMLQ